MLTGLRLSHEMGYAYDRLWVQNSMIVHWCACKNKMSDTSDDEKICVPTSRPVSGRMWRKTGSTGSRYKYGIIKEPTKTVEQKVMIRKQENYLRQITKDNLARIERLKEEKKERRRKNIQKQKEGELKSEVVQVIKNPAKLKRLKKKELRKIQKRDTLAANRKKEKSL